MGALPAAGGRRQALPLLGAAAALAAAAVPSRAEEQRPVAEALVSRRVLRHRHMLGRKFGTMGAPLAAGWPAAWIGMPSGRQAAPRSPPPPASAQSCQGPQAPASCFGGWAAELGRPIRQGGPPECRTVRLTCACLRTYGADCKD
uniref:EGF-like domain-containing protein n=1 Tax=Pyrodinium bahamense TaxID=73915 RepID=A0A7S0FFU7_9DINO